MEIGESGVIVQSRIWLNSPISNPINIFIDWAIKKKHVALIEINYNTTIMEFFSLKDIIEFINNQKLLNISLNTFLESGAPYPLLYQLVSNNFNVFIINNYLVKEYRGVREKTDINDAFYIQQLYYENPNLFKSLNLPEKNVIYIKYLSSKYKHITRAIARFKILQKAFQREFGENDVYLDLIKKWEKEKRKLFKEIYPLLEDDIQKVNIYGIGNVLTMQILTEAHPIRFNSLSSYLSYCGYIGNVGYKYNHQAKSTAYQMSVSCIRHKSPNYYPLYLKIKEDLKIKFLGDSKAKVNGRAINRLSTFLLKEIYRSVKNEQR